MAQLTLPIFDLTGKETSTIELNAAIFGVAANPTLLHQAVVAFLANKRAATASTKDRSQVSGTNRKPWKQKGTGNARVGSARSPLWRGGGITFGPNADRNYGQRMPQKMKQSALKVALSSKVAGDGFIVVDSLDALDGKTKTWITAASKLPKAESKKLVVGLAKNDMADRSIRNVQGVKYVSLEGLTIYDVVRYPVVMMTQDAIASLEKRLTNRAKEAVKA
ncbi:MAG TPA: 50S ribosomal protein L4 [Patescibacteria group bacterium]